MGSWDGFHLTLGAGDRDPEVVAADLHAELRRIVPDLYEYVESPYRDSEKSSVWHHGNVVHWETGECHDYGRKILDLREDDAIADLDVPADWMLGVLGREIEYEGSAALFAWLDGRYVKIDEVVGRLGRGGEDVVSYFEREWNVEGEPVQSLGSPDGDPSFTTREDGTAERDDDERRDDERFDERDGATLLGALDADAPAERRVAAETLFVAVEAGTVSFDGLPVRLFDALDDDSARFGAAATVRELDVSPDRVRETLDDSDPTVRRAAARYFACCDWSGEETTRALADALSDADAGVRAAAANALRRRVERHGSRKGRDAPPAPVGATPTLLEAARDDDPRVRADATLAAVQLAIYDGSGDHAEAAVEAFAAAATDANETVREHVVDFCDVEVERLAEAAPDGASTRLVGALAEAESKGSDVHRWVTLTAMHTPRYEADLVRPILDDLVELGWRADAKSAFAREAVTTMAEEARNDFSSVSPQHFAPVVDPLMDAIREGVAVEAGVEVLRTVAESDADALDTETLERLLD